MQMSTATNKIMPPEQWPNEVVQRYDAICELGHGGFASVVLAKDKVSGSCHAVKVVGSMDSTRQQLGYAMREIDILKELHHENIITLIDHWEPPANIHKCASVIALSYAKGPTLEKMLRFGRLGFTFSQVISAQLVDAITYLHGRAVVHRDVKPDNIIVTGATMDQDEIWEDSGSVHDCADKTLLLKKWHVTLIDFGFARALTPADMQKNPPKLAAGGANSNLDLSGKSTGSKSSLGRSYSRAFSRRMSSVGNKQYAAPEIINGVLRNRELNLDSTHHPIDVTKTLANHISFYGLMADAFSVGSTIKMMLTGAPPDEDVNALIAMENSPIAIVCKMLCGRRNKMVSSSSDRKFQYRSTRHIPKEVFRLIIGLTNGNPANRTSVRTARLYPWIDEILEHRTTKSQSIDYLSFAGGDATEVSESSDI